MTQSRLTPSPNPPPSHNVACVQFPRRPHRIIQSLALTLTILCGCTAIPLVDVPSANQNGRINHLVLHFTSEVFDESLTALTVQSERPVSAHYLVPRLEDVTYPHSTLKVYRLVNEHQRAWHAGLSFWGGETALNDRSIGIEIVNSSRCAPESLEALELPDLESICEFIDYPETQIELLIALAQDIIARHPDIEPLQVIGHADIAPERRIDPGPKFPWYRLHKAGVGAWPRAEDLAFFRDVLGPGPSTDLVRLTQASLAALGYPVAVNGELDHQTQRVVRSFQMHFRPKNYRGFVDIETTVIALALVKRYRQESLATLMERFSSP